MVDHEPSKVRVVRQGGAHNSAGKVAILGVTDIANIPAPDSDALLKSFQEQVRSQRHGRNFEKKHQNKMVR